jgi:hypothetical protein
MSLDYNIKQIPLDTKYPVVTDPEVIDYLRKHGKATGHDWYEEDGVVRLFSPKTEQLIWLTMSIGIGRITKQNWKKFFNRAYAWQRVREHDTIVTAQDVYDHIGLRTNASSLTDARFRTLLMGAAERGALRQIDSVNTTKEN